MNLLYVKALHVIFVVSWFAGLFYMVRLFIYTSEANQKEEPAKSILTQQLLTMQRKLWYIISWPAAIGTAVFGFWMYFVNFAFYAAQPWMWLKLMVVAILFLYHLQCHIIFRQQSKGIYKFSSFKLRLFNELATVLLVAIIFLVIVKSSGRLVWGLLGLFVFAGLLMGAVFIYKKQRQTSEVKDENKPTPPPINPQ